MEEQKIIAPYNYPYCEFEFTEWNPVQKQVYPYFEQDCNLVISSSVASGKTVNAEAIFGYELQTKPNSKTVYVSPLKALGKEKFDDWSKHPTFKKFTKVLVSSDEIVTKSDFENSRMIISTIESMNIRCRKQDKWIKDVKVFVFDEAHLFNDEHRGTGSESLLINFSLINKDCRIICLSGTLSNAKDIAKWLKNLNNKKTYCISSNWRPTQLIQKIEIADTLFEQEKIVENICKRNPNEKILIFVHSKKIGETLCKYLKNKNIFTAFYNADLRLGIKDRMIEDFKCGYSGLDVLITTSSLSMGINL